MTEWVRDIHGFNEIQALLIGAAKAAMRSP